jgi:FG-GAP repeat protein
MNRLAIRAARSAAVLALAVGTSFWPSSPAHAQFLEPGVQVLYSLQAEAPGDFFGFMAGAVGDLNGDGASELIIGAFQNAAGGPFAGRAYVYSGRDGALLNVVTGSASNRLGFSVAGVGDINKDGFPDYAVGGPGRFNAPAPQNGRVIVLSGKDHSVIYDLAGTHRSFFGYDVNAAGDVNGDSYPDIIAGAPLVSESAFFAGRVFTISGRDGSTLWHQDGISQESFLGTGVSGVADLDGDGLPEQAVGASGVVNGRRQSGQAYVLRGQNGAFLRTLKPSSTACDFGDFYVHASDDVNGDAVPDIYVADFCDNRLGPLTGRAYVFSGSGEEKLRVFNGEIAGDSFGAGRPVHDLDGDGVPEFIISANLSDAAAEDGGKTYLFSGKTGKILRTMTGTVPHLELGFDALPLGDVNGDGRTDFLLTGIDVAYVVAGDR